MKRRNALLLFLFGLLATLAVLGLLETALEADGSN